MDEQHEITIKISNETYYRLQLFIDAISYKRKDRYTVEEAVKSSLAHFLNRFYNNRMNEQDIEELIPLGSFGELTNTIAGYINELGIQPSDLAKEIQVTRATMSKILNNKQQPSLELFIRIWTVLGCPPLHKLLKREAKGSQSIVD